MTRTAAQIRQEFLDFFRERGHAIVPSSPVVPLDDPTLLFTNAGMNQFKPYFLGLETPRHLRVADTQKCIRAGGKHNDLDDVGHDTYHHTFFEMLGNWSFGDYFKKEAIAWAWELLVDVWGIDPTRLHATHFGGDAAEGLEPDTEARDLWRQILPPERVHAGSKKDNFWEMGETGPCGPCSEIHIDLTADKSGAKLVNAGDARVIEIWNLVFIQFDRAADGKLTPLPAKHVDTGMGLERVAAVIQGKQSNYDTDIFTPIFGAIHDATGAPPYRGTVPTGGVAGEPGAKDPQIMTDVSYRVIGDHIRCLIFAITDGAVPDREDRGSVLRRILRRAALHGREFLRTRGPFLWRLVSPVVDSMGAVFPEVRGHPATVAKVIREEEDLFERTLDRGIRFWNRAAMHAVWRSLKPGYELIGPLPAGGPGGPRSAVEFEGVFSGDPDEQFDLVKGGKSVTGLTAGMLGRDTVRACLADVPTISGEDAFKLHGTYGFPIDLTQIMASEKGLTVDIAEYERLMEGAKERARAASPSGSVPILDQWHPQAVAVCDETPKYDDGLTCTATIRMLHHRSPSISVGTEVVVITDRTCFYAEQGGQVSDTGVIETDTGELHVTSVGRALGNVAHVGVVTRGTIVVDQTCRMRVDGRRRATMKNHTATHVMNWALRDVLGEHVQQKGSLVDHEKTRFDFSHPKPLTPEEVERVEQLVNKQVRANLPVYYKIVPQQDALKINGLRAVFGERYPDEVRVMAIGVKVEDLVSSPGNPEWRKYSVEFCGGTHLNATGQIEHFAITTEEAVAKGIRRIVAVTGDTARRIEETGAAFVQRAEQLKRGPADAVAGGVAELQNSLATATLPLRHRHQLRELMAELQAIVKQQQKSDAADAAEIVKRAVAALLEHAEKIGNTTAVVGEMPDVPLEQLKMGADWIKQKCGSAAVLFGVRVLPSHEATEPRSHEGTVAAGDRLQTGSTGKALLLAAMTPDLVKKGLKAGDLVKAIAPIIGGGGGGPPTMAQAGGKQPEKISEALSAGRDWIRAKL